MIQINESIIDVNDSLLTHIAIDYILESHQYELFEKYGVYDGCQELVNYIIKKLKSKFKQGLTSFTLDILGKNIKNFNNIFFDKLIIDIKISNNISNGGYITDKDIKLNKDNKIDIIEIKYNINKNKFENDLRSLLYHELTHIYQNYCMILTNKSFYDLLDNQHYVNFIKGKMSNNNVKQIISDVLYHINKTEQHAYISELQSELENNKSKIHGPQEALNIIKNSVSYKNIIQSKEILYGLINNSYSKELQEKIYNIYRELNECDWTDNKIKKKLINQIDKYISKVEKIIPKMCLDFLENNIIEIKEEHHRKIISLKDYLKDN